MEQYMRWVQIVCKQDVKGSSRPNFEALFQQYSLGTEENHEYKSTELN